MDYKHNDFVKKLLAFQQDGNKSISGPSLWEEDNLFDVDTPFIKEILHEVERFLDKEEVFWYFLLGSPGNGKSHIVGKLYKEFKGPLGLKHDEIRNCDPLPYVMKWSKPGEKFHRVWFVQDASAVQDKFSKDADEANDLKNVLVQAVDKNVSIIVCANRGILERVVAQAAPEEKQEEWFKAANYLVSSDEGGRTIRVGRKRDGIGKVIKNALDHESLFANQNAIVLSVFDEALKENNWKDCLECKAHKYCPFYANKRSLSEQHWREIIIEVLRNAELLSGQMIVFRELLALISGVLAGASKDYDEHPCDWVRERVEGLNLLPLLSKRFYYQLFASEDVCGLDTAMIASEEADKLLGLLKSKLDGDSKKGLTAFLSQERPTTELGLPRLLGKEGGVSIQDPIRSGLTFDFLARWALDSPTLLDDLKSIPGPTELEVGAIKDWLSYVDAIEGENTDEASDIASVVTRISSAFLLRLGALNERRTHFHEPLKKFRELIDTMVSYPKGDLPAEVKKSLLKWETDLNAVLSDVSYLPDGQEVRLNEFLTVSGDAIRPLKKIKILNQLQPPYLRLSCVFGGTNSSDHMNTDIYLDGLVYAWMDTVRSSGMLPQSIPSQIFMAILQAQNRAVSRSNFSRSAEKIILRIKGCETELVGEEDFAVIGGQG